MCTGTPADCGEQSKQRTLSPVSEQTHKDVDNCMLEHVETFEKKSQENVKFCIDSALSSLSTLGRCIHIHTLYGWLGFFLFNFYCITLQDTDILYTNHKL